jgi:DNA repair protein RecO (recombination protein O)
MLTKSAAIVLHSFKYGETKVVVDVFTRLHGRLAFMVGLPKTPRGRLKKQYFQPLSVLNIEYDYRQQLNFQKMHDAAILTPLPNLLCEPGKLSISLFLAEFLYHALKGEQQNEALFDYVLSGMEWLNSREHSYANFHLVFLMHLTRFLGFYPNLEDVSTVQYFDLRSATFCTQPPTHRDFLMPQEAKVLHLMMRMDFSNLHLFRMNRSQRNRCIEVALLFYRLHLPDFPDLRSLGVLHELWN